MVQNGDYRLPMPNSSWATLQKILRAYNAVRDREKPTVQDIAELAGIHRPNVSANNNFLRDLGLLREDGNKLSELGTLLATGLDLNNGTMISEGIQESVRRSSGLSKLIDMFRARGTMTYETFEGQVVTLARLTAKSLGLSYVGTLADYLTEGGLIREEGDNLIFVGREPSVQREQSVFSEESGEKPPPPPPPGVPDGIPIPLGVNKRAFLVLPEDWTSRDLPKLIKMIQLALGEDTGE
jgi:hypothetical protein